MKCAKHSKVMDLIEVERGKTIYQCADCEAERRARLAEMFGHAEVSRGVAHAMERFNAKMRENGSDFQVTVPPVKEEQ